MHNSFDNMHCLSKDFPILDFLATSTIVVSSLALSEHVLVDMGRPSHKNNQLNLNNSTLSRDYHHFPDLLRWGAGGSGGWMKHLLHKYLITKYTKCTHSLASTGDGRCHLNQAPMRYRRKWDRRRSWLTTSLAYAKPSLTKCRRSSRPSDTSSDLNQLI